LEMKSQQLQMHHTQVYRSSTTNVTQPSFHKSEAIMPLPT